MHEVLRVHLLKPHQYKVQLEMVCDATKPEDNQNVTHKKGRKYLTRFWKVLRDPAEVLEGICSKDICSEYF